MTTLASDWHDIDAVVDHVRALRHVDKLNLLAWSLGGPRSAGYAAQHPDKVARLVLLAPAYNRAAKADPPAQVPANGAAFNTQSRSEFIANWDRQVGCPEQYEPGALDSVWSEMIASDPVGATWGTRCAARPAGNHLGMDHGGGGENADPHANGFRRARQAGQSRPRARTLHRLGLTQKGVRRSGVFVAQRYVGEEPSAACSARRWSG